MRRIVGLCGLGLLLILLAGVPVYAQATGVIVNCDKGGGFDNGVKVTVVQMRSGFDYTATAIGINGFDPVLAVLDANGNGICTDDDATAAEYSAFLPTTGQIDSSSRNSQIHFANTSGNAFENVSLVVGGSGNQEGQFLLILEGMAVTSADGAGDAFSLQVTPAMVASGVPLTMYMISITDVMDPLMVAIDGEYNFLKDANDNYIACNNAGDTKSCWGESSRLSGMYVSRTEGRKLGGFGYDAMLTFPLADSFTDQYINVLMRSYQQQTFGDYLVAFHMGIGTVEKGPDV